MPIFENKYLTLKNYEHKISQTVYCAWKDFWENETEIQTALDISQEYLRTNQIKVMISDCSTLETIPLSTQDYINQIWYPTAQKNGLIAEILVDSEHFMGQATLDVLLDEARQHTKLIFATVQNMEQAEQLTQEILTRYTKSV